MNDYNTAVFTTQRDEIKPLKKSKKTKIFFCQPAGYRNKTMTDAKSLAVKHVEAVEVKLKSERQRLNKRRRQACKPKSEGERNRHRPSGRWFNDEEEK